MLPYKSQTAKTGRPRYRNVSSEGWQTVKIIFGVPMKVKQLLASQDMELHFSNTECISHVSFPWDYHKLLQRNEVGWYQLHLRPTKGKRKHRPTHTQHFEESFIRFFRLRLRKIFRFKIYGSKCANFDSLQL